MAGREEHVPPRDSGARPCMSPMGAEQQLSPPPKSRREHPGDGKWLRVTMETGPPARHAKGTHRAEGTRALRSTGHPGATATEPVARRGPGTRRSRVRGAMGCDPGGVSPRLGAPLRRGRRFPEQPPANAHRQVAQPRGTRGPRYGAVGTTRTWPPPGCPGLVRFGTAEPGFRQGAARCQGQGPCGFLPAAVPGATRGFTRRLGSEDDVDVPPPGAAVAGLSMALAINPPLHSRASELCASPRHEAALAGPVARREVTWWPVAPPPIGISSVPRPRCHRPKSALGGPRGRPQRRGSPRFPRRGWAQHPASSPRRRSPGVCRDADAARPSVRPSFKFKDQRGDKKKKEERGSEEQGGSEGGGVAEHRRGAARFVRRNAARRSWREPGDARLGTDVLAPPGTRSLRPGPVAPPRRPPAPRGVSVFLPCLAGHVPAPAPAGGSGALSSAHSGPRRPAAVGKMQPSPPPPCAGCRECPQAPGDGAVTRTWAHIVMLGVRFPAPREHPPRPRTSRCPPRLPGERGGTRVPAAALPRAVGGGSRVEVCVAMGLPSHGVSMAAARCCGALPEVRSPPGMPQHRERPAAAVTTTAPRHRGAPAAPPPLPPPQGSQSPFPRVVFSSLRFSG
ncbi:collagen, type I, alpha 1a-like [Caloenas nicobarica]|uniref:collagen, type I, alpha 1a-like n=1 Tax=Caloenas nicobarica TaxID=187106 RepID=UPI0032B7F192